MPHTSDEHGLVGEHHGQVDSLACLTMPDDLFTIRNTSVCGKTDHLSAVEHIDRKSRRVTQTFIEQVSFVIFITNDFLTCNQPVHQKRLDKSNSWPHTLVFYSVLQMLPKPNNKCRHQKYSLHSDLHLVINIIYKYNNQS